MPSNTYRVVFTHLETNNMHSEYRVTAPNENVAVSIASRRFGNLYGYTPTEYYKSGVTLLAEDNDSESETVPETPAESVGEN